MTDDLSNEWRERAVLYRSENPIAESLASAGKIKVDISIIKELHSYFPHLESKEKKVKAIMGPADLSVGLEVAAQILAIKDRATSITLKYEDFKGRLERLHHVVQSLVFLKKEVLHLKNDTQRNSVISLTCPEIEEKLAKVNRVLTACSSVVRNINQTYNILKIQVEIIKEMMYEGGLTSATRHNSSDKTTLAERI